MGRKFLALRPSERMLLGQTLLALAWARIHLWTRRTAFSPRRQPSDGSRVLRPYRASDPSRIAWSINIAARFIPRATCLVRALAAQRLLTRHGHASDLYIGVANSAESGFEAHAWIECRGTVLVGRTERPYAPLLTRSAVS